MYKLQILRQAREDMQKSAEWYDEQQDGLGNRFLFQVIRAIKLAEANPLHYQQRFSKKFRFVTVGDFPFVIVFTMKKNFVVINAVFHTKRNPKRFV